MAIKFGTPTPYDQRTYTDENSLATLGLSEPDKLSMTVTRLMHDDYIGKFSFLAMTEGQGLASTTGKSGEGLNNVEYVYPIMENIQHTMEVVRMNAAYVSPGIANTLFEVVFTTRLCPHQYGMLAPDKQTQVHVHYEPSRVADGWLYRLQLRTADNTAFCGIDNLLVGKRWVIIAPAVAESGSRGNRSSSQGIEWMTNQISFKRYSKEIQGNLANKVVPIIFDGANTTDGKAKTLWINEEMRQFEVWMRQMNNHDLYLSEYNRDVNGQIYLLDPESNKPIPLGAGVREHIVAVGNHDTYGFSLTTTKLKTTVGDIFWGEPDSKAMEIVIHGGQGFLEDFHGAIMNDIANSNFIMPVEMIKAVSGKNGMLSYGAYFNQYKTVTGHTITAIHDLMFDIGLLGELDKANGNLHPRTGYPMSSHTGVFMDYSTYNGSRNIELKYQTGQSYISKVIPGLAPIPKSWGTISQGMAATDVDNARYEVKMSRGINIKNPNRCFILESQL